MKKGFLLVPLLALALLSACADSSTGGGWEETDQTSFDLVQAADVQEESKADLSALRFDLDKDSYGQAAWLDENNLLCVKREWPTQKTDGSLVALTLDGEETVLDSAIDSFVVTQVQNGSVAYAPYNEMVLEDGITFSVWDGESRTLTPVYQFEDGCAWGFQQFFSPDGSRAAFPWKPDTTPEGSWQIRVVDMETGETQDLTPPQWDTDAEATILVSHWLDDGTLSVTETEDIADGSDCIAWTYTF